MRKDEKEVYKQILSLADIDTYRDGAYAGGIPATRFIDDWCNRVRKVSPKWGEQADLVKLMAAHPFDGGLWEMISAKPDNEGLPCFLAATQIFILHGRGAFEAWRVRNPEITHLQLVDFDYYPWPSHQASGKILQFLDCYLKGADSKDLERVGIQVRLGDKQWYWRTESSWPVPGTQYTRWYLRNDGTLSMSAEKGSEKPFAYPTKLPPSGKRSGVSFHSPPFEETVELAGHFTAALSISSSTSDADVVVTLWAINETGTVVAFGANGQPQPLAKGFLRASHRKLDPLKSLPERPWHTHRLEDHAPLSENEVVVVDVEIFPAAARVRARWRLRLDVTPSEHQPDIPGYNPPEMRTYYGESHDGDVNVVHVGRDLVNYISCPVVPGKGGQCNAL